MSRVIAANEYRRERWRNGLGWTREIHAHRPDPGSDWAWRLSIAEIERDAPFSAFPGVDRELVLLHGNGLRLRRSEEHTSELQSLMRNSYAVFCLKKKKTPNQIQKK